MAYPSIRPVLSTAPRLPVRYRSLLLPYLPIFLKHYKASSAHLDRLPRHLHYRKTA
jgi:hypothetical protein